MTLGELTETSGNVFNLIILLGKRFIFGAAGVDSLNISHFRMFIKRYFILEGYMASQKENVKKHLGKVY